jgi:hypothetical protein
MVDASRSIVTTSHWTVWCEESVVWGPWVKQWNQMIDGDKIAEGLSLRYCRYSAVTYSAGKERDFVLKIFTKGNMNIDTLYYYF